MEILPPCPALEDRPGKVCSAEWEFVMIPAGLLLGSCFSFIASPDLGRHGSRQNWTGSRFFSISAKVAIGARFLGLVPKCLWNQQPSSLLQGWIASWHFTPAAGGNEEFWRSQRCPIPTARLTAYSAKLMNSDKAGNSDKCILRVEYTLLFYTSLPSVDSVLLCIALGFCKVPMDYKSWQFIPFM